MRKYALIVTLVVVLMAAAVSAVTNWANAAPEPAPVVAMQYRVVRETPGLQCPGINVSPCQYIEQIRFAPGTIVTVYNSREGETVETVARSWWPFRGRWFVRVFFAGGLNNAAWVDFADLEPFEAAP